MNRHEFLKVLAGGAVAAALPRICLAQTPGPATFTYKVAGGCQIKADVYGAVLVQREMETSMGGLGSLRC